MLTPRKAGPMVRPRLGLRKGLTVSTGSMAFTDTVGFARRVLARHGMGSAEERYPQMPLVFREEPEAEAAQAVTDVKLTQLTMKLILQLSEYHIVQKHEQVSKTDTMGYRVLMQSLNTCLNTLQLRDRETSRELREVVRTLTAPPAQLRTEVREAQVLRLQQQLRAELVRTEYDKTDLERSRESRRETLQQNLLRETQIRLPQQGAAMAQHKERLLKTLDILRLEEQTVIWKLIQNQMTLRKGEEASPAREEPTQKSDQQKPSPQQIPKERTGAQAQSTESAVPPVREQLRSYIRATNHREYARLLERLETVVLEDGPSMQISQELPAQLGKLLRQAEPVLTQIAQAARQQQLHREQLLRQLEGTAPEAKTAFAVLALQSGIFPQQHTTILSAAPHDGLGRLLRESSRTELQTITQWAELQRELVIHRERESEVPAAELRQFLLQTKSERQQVLTRLVEKLPRQEVHFLLQQLSGSTELPREPQRAIPALVTLLERSPVQERLVERLQSRAATSYRSPGVLRVQSMQISQKLVNRMEQFTRQRWETHTEARQQLLEGLDLREQRELLTYLTMPLPMLPLESDGGSRRGIPIGERLEKLLTVRSQEEFRRVQHRVASRIHPPQGAPSPMLPIQSTSERVHSSTSITTIHRESKQAQPMGTVPVLQKATELREQTQLPATTERTVERQLTTATLHREAQPIGRPPVSQKTTERTVERQLTTATLHREAQPIGTPPVSQKTTERTVERQLTAATFHREAQPIGTPPISQKTTERTLERQLTTATLHREAQPIGTPPISQKTTERTVERQLTTATIHREIQPMGTVPVLQKATELRERTQLPATTERTVERQLTAATLHREAQPIGMSPVSQKTTERTVERQLTTATLHREIQPIGRPPASQKTTERMVERQLTTATLHREAQPIGRPPASQKTTERTVERQLTTATIHREIQPQPVEARSISQQEHIPRQGQDPAGVWEAAELPPLQLQTQPSLQQQEVDAGAVLREIRTRRREQIIRSVEPVLMTHIQPEINTIHRTDRPSKWTSEYPAVSRWAQLSRAPSASNKQPTDPREAVAMLQRSGKRAEQPAYPMTEEVLALRQEREASQSIQTRETVRSVELAVRKQAPELQRLQQSSREQVQTVKEQEKQLTSLKQQMEQQEKRLTQALQRPPAALTEDPAQVKKMARAVMKELESQLRLERQRRGM